MLVFGTRPEAIKMAPVTDALVARGLRPELIVTGQHPALDLEGVGLGGMITHRLGCGGLPDPMAHAGLVAEAVKPVLRRRGCDLLLVHGDTSSALGGALGGFEAGIPVGHVEAGLRSFDSANPGRRRTTASPSTPAPPSSSPRPRPAPPTSAAKG